MQPLYTVLQRSPFNVHIEDLKMNWTSIAILSEKAQLERTVLHHSDQIKILNSSATASTTGAFNKNTQARLLHLEKDNVDLQNRLIETEQICQIAASSADLVQLKVNEIVRNRISRGPSLERPGKRTRQGSNDTELSSEDAQSNIMDTGTDTVEELKTLFLAEFQKMNKSIENYASTLHKRIDEIETRISRQRAQSPGNVSMNESFTSPRNSQPLAINMNAPPTQSMTQKKPQAKFASLSHAQALAASTIPLNAIRNIRIMGDHEEASVTALKLKNDKRSIECGIREISHSARTAAVLVIKKTTARIHRHASTVQRNTSPSNVMTFPITQNVLTVFNTTKAVPPQTTNITTHIKLTLHSVWYAVYTLTPWKETRNNK